MQQVCKFFNSEIQSGGDHDRYFFSSHHRFRSSFHISNRNPAGSSIFRR